MLSYALGALLVGSAVANPVPTAIDAAQAASLKVRRDNTQCPTPSADDTPEAFTSNPAFSSAASTAETPNGYQPIFQNQLGAASVPYGFLSYDVLETYSTTECSNRCNAITDCQSFNIYYERDPTIPPTTNCTNPSSQPQIKCAYYTGPLPSGSQTNTGQYQSTFKVVIAGSNAYTLSSLLSVPEGYTSPTSLGSFAIHAPLSCAGYDTYMGLKTFSPPFSLNNCANACSAQTAYNRQYPAADGSFQTCRFFNTYVLLDDAGESAVGQQCALYNETWSQAFATNGGYYDAAGEFVAVAWSYSAAVEGADEEAGGDGCVNPSRLV